MDFEIEDIVKLSSEDGLRIVSGVIHDDERLFTTGIYSREELENSFNDVEQRWAKKEL